MRVALLGFGLIGGSIARALRRTDGDWTIAAWSPSERGPRTALAARIVDRASATPADATHDADLVVLAAPPLACLELLDEMASPGRLPRDAVVTDVASTKEAIGRRADEAGLRFVGGHPMAGRESAGFDASAADLFEGRPWVLVPGAHAQPGDRLRVESLVDACGARPVELSAADHDFAVAGISHLPLVVSAALVEAVAGTDDRTATGDWPIARSLAAGGWQGMTRLARGDVEMGAGILATNAPAIAARLRDLRAVLDGWLTELDSDNGPDFGAVSARLAAARERLEDEA